MEQRTVPTIGSQLQSLKPEQFPCDQFWTEHRTTLIAYETQYVLHNLKPEMQDEDSEIKRLKARKKNIEYEGGFLFPGREGNKEQNIDQLILNSKHSNLKELFDPNSNRSKDQLKLCEFVRIMLELKHSTILNEFMEIYNLIVSKIKDVKTERLIEEHQRASFVEEVAGIVAGYVQNRQYQFVSFSKFMKSNTKQTTKYFKVTVYCFLAQLFHFQINQFYCQAFDISQSQGNPHKKKKLPDIEEIQQ